MALTKPGAAAVRVWTATLVAADPGLRRWLDDRERDRLSRYESQADRARFLLGAAMLRSAVGLELGVRPQDVEVDRACPSCGRWHGRPRVPDSPLELSVSHGGVVVALALARGSRVGIDVEPAARPGLSDAESWTRAEARLKAGGDADLVVRGLPAPVPGYAVSLATAAGAAVQVRPGVELLSAGASACDPSGPISGQAGR
jgi:4'-phosphopantetheinyl transferase